MVLGFFVHICPGTLSEAGHHLSPQGARNLQCQEHVVQHIYHANFISSVKIFKTKTKPNSQMLTKQLPNLDERRFNTFYRAPVTTDLFIPIFYESEPLFRLQINRVICLLL